VFANLILHQKFKLVGHDKPGCLPYLTILAKNWWETNRRLHATLPVFDRGHSPTE